MFALLAWCTTSIDLTEVSVATGVWYGRQVSANVYEVGETDIVALRRDIGFALPWTVEYTNHTSLGFRYGDIFRSFRHVSTDCHHRLGNDVCISLTVLPCTISSDNGFEYQACRSGFRSCGMSLLHGGVWNTVSCQNTPSTGVPILASRTHTPNLRSGVSADSLHKI